MHQIFRGIRRILPCVLAGLIVALPAQLPVEISPSLRTGLLAASTAWIGVELALLLVEFRLRALVGAVERIAAGETSVTVAGRRWLVGGRLSDAIAEAAVTMERTREAATTDRLTGIANRPALLSTLVDEVERTARHMRPLSVAFLDIDHFKSVNDTYGHDAGDQVLRGVAATLRDNVRTNDLIGRYGGEEFMLILSETDPEQASIAAEKLRTLVARQVHSVPGNPALNVTISIGVAGGAGSRLRVEHLIRDADAAMYSAKALGRNQTYVFTEPDEDARVPRAPISPDGRARAVALGRSAREAAAAVLTAVIAPLPHYRGRPSALIAAIATEMAGRLELSEHEIDRIRIAALLHDIGKVAIPDQILEKPAPLTTAEWRTVTEHPRIGQIILDQATTLREAAPIILHHHERYAGNGYPYGLRGNDIPLGARLVSIADAYDAMIHDRPYKRAISHDEAVQELRRHAGTQFDPELVKLFCEIYADRVPQPDETVVAMMGQIAPGPGPIVVPFASHGQPAGENDAAPARPRRRRRQAAG